VKIWTESVSPSVLSVCRDSRSEAVKFYRLLECKNAWYRNDDGTVGDAGEAGANYNWEDWDFDLENSISLPPLDNDEPNQKPQHLTNDDKVPIFRAYLGHNDIVYLDPRHNIDYNAFLSTLTVISWEDPIIPRIALNTDAFLDDYEHNTFMNQLLETISYVSPTQVILVRRDNCCWSGGKHKRSVDLVEGVETRAEKAILERLKSKFEDFWKGYVGADWAMPEVTSAVARRI
jgi:hypothetical protein